MTQGQLARPGWESVSEANSTATIDETAFTEVDVFPPLSEISHGQLYGIRLSNTTVDMTHGLHRFPAKFIPQIPRWALREFGTPRMSVLDPFMGSGTTLVEAMLRPGLVRGCDVDPLARLISRAKTDAPDPERIALLANSVRARWRGPAKRLTVPMPGVTNFDHWFSQETWGLLQSLLNTLLDLDATESERRFLLAVFSSILRRVSNADDQSQKTYVSGTRLKTPPPVPATFWRALEKATVGLRALVLAKHADSKVSIDDAADAVHTRLRDASVDLIVTSPPYLESLDYMYNAMLEYFWLGSYVGVPDRDALNELRRSQIGSRRPHSRCDLPSPLIGHVDPQNLPGWRKAGALAYFAHMAAHFEEAARCLRGDGRYVLVVGNSQTRMATVPVHDCLTRLAASCGLALEKAFAYRVRRHYMKFPRMGRGGIILLDWVIVLRRCNAPAPIPDPLPLPDFSLPTNAVST